MRIGSIRKKVAHIGLAVTAPLIIAAPFNRGASRLPVVQRETTNWLRFDTDACGHVNRLQNRHFLPKGSPAADPDEGDDEDEWVNAWNMSPEESEVLNDWMLQHPEIATVTSAVQKSCDDEADPVDNPDELQIA